VHPWLDGLCGDVRLKDFLKKNEFGMRNSSPIGRILTQG
jgi:hypothetical protein